MKTKMAMLAMCVFLAANAAQAEVWSTNLACFKGEYYDGWDQCTMIKAMGLGGAQVSFSSGSDQLFDWLEAGPALATMTIAVEDPMGTITNGGTIQVSVPAGWPCRFAAGVSVSYGGNAASKVGAATFSGDGRTLLIPVSQAFLANDTLTVSGVKLADLRLVLPADVQRMELDFTGDGVRDGYDKYTMQVRAQWAGGAYDGWAITMSEYCRLLAAGTIFYII